MRIARSFNCGKEHQKKSSPGGAADKIVAGDSVAPPGLVIFMASKPAVETAGYSRLSLRDETPPVQAAGEKARTLREVPPAHALARNHPADGKRKFLAK